MKKTYTKPQFAVELFTFSQSIATGCDAPPEGSTLGIPMHASKEECGWDVGGMILFQDIEKGCLDIQASADEDVYGYCYDNPNGGITIFASF